jgi:hypothetical protein
MNLVKKSNNVIEANAPSYTLWYERMDEYPTEWDEQAVMSLDESGTIQDYSKSCGRLFGYQHINLVWQHVSMLIPRLLGVALVQKGRLNPLINFLCHCEHIFQAQNLRGDTFPCRLSFIHLEYDGKPTLRLMVHPVNNI